MARKLVPFLVFLFSFFIRLPALNPAFDGDDSPETAAACATLGIQHPPGYPLHTLAGRVFGLLPLGSPAFRLNLFAAACSALAASLVSLALLPGGTLGALTAGLLAGSSGLIWAQGLSGKGSLYGLQISLLALLFL